ncbi:MAG: tetratricopeptide repeat protein [Acidobacteria bacterium]|nr:tetratricopeptide repeat protein [Acidobacteriota bacterium]
MQRPRFGAGLGLALFSLLVCCHQPDLKRLPTFPSILLITIDTLRADALGCYGNNKVRTPNLDRIAREGVLFKNAYAQTPLTLPSHCSIMTGTYPMTHRVRDNSGFVLSKGSTTLPEFLQSERYVTGAFVGSFVLDSRFGLNQGFGDYDDRIPVVSGERATETAERRADQVAMAATRWMERYSAQPFFCWIHLYDPHTPYAPPDSYRKQYPQDLYAGEVAFTDSVIGSLIQFLDAKNLYQKSLIIVTGDHGESLGEHGESTHGFFIYDSTLRVPLLIKLPGNEAAGMVLQHLVQSVDILPTVVECLQMKTPREVQGRGLLALIRNKGSAWSNDLYSETYYPRLTFGWSELRGLRHDRYKYIEAPEPELYDLELDPAESTNIIGRNTALDSQLRRQLIEMESRFKAPAEERPPTSTLGRLAEANLRSLGYLASSRSRDSSAVHGLADPKAKLAVYEFFSTSQAELVAGNTLKAETILRRVLLREPQMAVARQQLASVYFSSKRYPEAIQEYEQALEIQPRLPVAAFNLGLAHFRVQHFSEAVSAFQRAIQLDASDYEAWNYLGLSYTETGNSSEAEEAFRKCMAIRADFAPAYRNLGLIYRKAGRNEEALGLLRESIRQDAGSPVAFDALGSVLLDLGRTDESVDNYRKAIELAPEDAQIRYNFGNALAAQGKFDLAIRAYQLSVQYDPKFALAYNNLGNSYTVTGLPDKAISCYQRALVLDPKFSIAANNIGKVYLTSNRCLLASRYFHRAVESDPKFAEAHFLLAKALQCLGRFEEARQEFNLAQQLGWTTARNY